MRYSNLKAMNREIKGADGKRMERDRARERELKGIMDGLNAQQWNILGKDRF